jgi:hypothetical protein
MRAQMGPMYRFSGTTRGFNPQLDHPFGVELLGNVNHFNFVTQVEELDEGARRLQATAKGLRA